MTFELIKQGGVTMFLILVCAVIALSVFIERWIHLHRARLNVNDFMHGIRNAIARGSCREALDACDNVPGPVAATLKVILENRTKERPELQAIVQEAAELEIPRMEKRVVWLSTMATLTPVLGLLGTILGMMQAFQEIQKVGASVSVSLLSAGIWQSLVTAAAGLMVAIPCYLAYNLIVGKIQSIVYDMERVSLEMVVFFTSQPKDVIRLDEKLAEMKITEVSFGKERDATDSKK
ncbi:MAG: MotA/TolQ/ExbB proton channel family protein [Verrucomicrobiae bacterium]|nr:MotA/TolQ/ExbB proton channel family protein [Verrucomicrobiae bacterium]